ncbi:hypothetical protein Hanom_Chr16g01440851 [Helianthus anomalus]
MFADIFLLQNYFNLDRFKGTEEKDGIKLGIREECANAYMNRKRRCKAHFERTGGYEDIARARTRPPEGLSPEAWEILINDLYLDPKYKDYCLKNKVNRAKQPFKSSHGSQSYAQKRHLNVIVLVLSIDLLTPLLNLYKIIFVVYRLKNS